MDIMNIQKYTYLLNNTLLDLEKIDWYVYTECMGVKYKAYTMLVLSKD